MTTGMTSDRDFLYIQAFVRWCFFTTHTLKHICSVLAGQNAYLFTTPNRNFLTNLNESRLFHDFQCLLKLRVVPEWPLPCGRHPRNNLRPLFSNGRPRSTWSPTPSQLRLALSSLYPPPSHPRMCAWGQRVYSPGEDNFSSVKSPSINVPISFVPLGAPVSVEKKPSRLVRVGFRPKELDKALFTYPRSPYPSAPTSSKNKENPEISRVARTRSLDSPRSRRAVKRPASLNVRVGRPATPRISSTPLANKFLSPVPESPATVTIASTRLDKEFWDSVSLQDPDKEIIRPSVLETHEGSTPISAVPRFIFSTKDGLLWSPGLPSKEPSSVAEIRIPADWTASEFPKSDRWTVTSPKEHVLDYPSIECVLSVDATTTSYPPPVLNQESFGVVN
ncbi:hypothetical protein B0H16DRAFT_268108 [Mycena metata]|uniref:Uncharacterized protein n=1 Tax=Mycena metata TaxID=1033252 RepID=A0AAD7HR42_9AGAR|nr:hypothetical protein B0H16DRAFT_268108 [Mycena metata]